MKTERSTRDYINDTYKRLADKLDSTLASFETLIADLQEINERVCAKLLEELRTGKISAYSASCAQANIVNASGKIQKQILEVVAAINDAGAIDLRELPANESAEDKKLRRVSEKMLTLLARNQAAHDGKR
jgi:hypothetical protein